MMGGNAAVLVLVTVLAALLPAAIGVSQCSLQQNCLGLSYEHTTGDEGEDRVRVCMTWRTGGNCGSGDKFHLTCAVREEFGAAAWLGKWTSDTTFCDTAVFPTSDSPDAAKQVSPAQRP